MPVGPALSTRISSLNTIVTSPLRPEMPEPQYGAPHIFAMFFQIRRAFYHIFEFIIGTSPAANRLRLGSGSLFSLMTWRVTSASSTVLGISLHSLLASSGSGKELVARAIAFVLFH